MTKKKAAPLGTCMMAAALLTATRASFGQLPTKPVVQMVELEIDPAHLAEYQAALKEEISTSIRVEPGVLRLYAVSVEGHPEQIRQFEVYADQQALESHMKSPHFMKYKATVQGFVEARKLMAADPLLLGSK